MSLHPNGRLCSPEYEFMLCAANIKLLLCDCLEPRAPTPAQADQIVQLLEAGLGSRGDSGKYFRLVKLAVEAGKWLQDKERWQVITAHAKRSELRWRRRSRGKSAVECQKLKGSLA